MNSTCPPNVDNIGNLFATMIMGSRVERDTEYHFSADVQQPYPCCVEIQAEAGARGRRAHPLRDPDHLDFLRIVLTCWG